MTTKELKNIPLLKVTLYPIYLRAKRYYYREHKINRLFGKRIDKQVYIIRRPPKDYGFFSNFFYVLGHLCYADRGDYIPVVDMENYKTLYNEKEPFLGTFNAWEYYFGQPDFISLKEAYKCKNALISSDNYFCEYVPIYTGEHADFITSSKVSELSKIVKKYIKIRSDVKEQVEQFYREMVNENVLGVHYRGTDMNVYPGHPRPSSIEEYICRINIIVKQYNIRCVVICSDEEKIVELAKREVVCEVKFTNAFRSCEGNTGIHQLSDDRRLHKYNLGREVLVDALILSKCTYLMCGCSNVAFAAILFNDNKYLEVFHTPVCNY